MFIEEASLHSIPTIARLGAMSIVLLLAGCNTKGDDPDEGVVDDGTTMDVDTTGTDGTDSTDEVINECDVWTQDCPDGEKCVPWADDGGLSWTALRCAPVLGAGQPGDSCMLMGDSELTGLDSCALGSICMRLDDGTDNGICVPQCQGSADSPTCEDSGRVCSIGNDGVLTLCMESCNPTIQGCPDGLSCIPRWDDGDFICWPDFSGPTGAYADECMYTNSCDPGLICYYPEAVPGCTGASCCTPYCNLDAPDPDSMCPGQAEGQICQPLELSGQPQPGLENVGVCEIPT